MSDELRKLRESIKRSQALIEAAMKAMDVVLEDEPKAPQTETELPTPTEKPPRSE